MGEQRDGQEGWDVLTQVTKCSLVWKGSTASAPSPTLVKGWEMEKQREIENERKNWGGEKEMVKKGEVRR